MCYTTICFTIMLRTSSGKKICHIFIKSNNLLVIYIFLNILTIYLMLPVEIRFLSISFWHRNKLKYSLYPVLSALFKIWYVNFDYDFACLLFFQSKSTKRMCGVGRYNVVELSAWLITWSFCVIIGRVGLA